MGRINVTFPIFVDSNVQLTMNYRLDDVKHNSVLLPSVHARAYCRSYLGPMPIPSPILTPSPISCLPTFHGDDDRRQVCDVLVGMFCVSGWVSWMRVAGRRSIGARWGVHLARVMLIDRCQQEAVNLPG